MKPLEDEAEPGQTEPGELAVRERVEPGSHDLDRSRAMGTSMPPISWSKR